MLKKSEVMKNAKDLFLAGYVLHVCNCVSSVLVTEGLKANNPSCFDTLESIKADIIELIDGHVTVGLWLGTAVLSHSVVERQYRIAIFDVLIARYEKEEQS